MQDYLEKDPMQKEEKYPNHLRNNLYKLDIFVLKLLPIILAILALSSTILDYINISCQIINYAMVFVLYVFLYISSYVFKFCEYHRMFLHYVVTVNILNIIDVYVGIPLSDFNLLKMYLIISGIFLLVILYLYVEGNKRYFIKNNR